MPTHYFCPRLDRIADALRDTVEGHVHDLLTQHDVSDAGPVTRAQ